MINFNTPLKVCSSVILKNRIVVPPMASATASEDGFVTDKTLAHYEKLSRSGASMLMVEYSYVDITGKSESHQLGISSDKMIDGLKELNCTIKKRGLVSAIQLTHSGAKSSEVFTGESLISPSGIRVPTKGEALEVPRASGLDDIIKLKESFLLAATRAVEAGFDVVELHTAHGYGLNQWLSPITNKRTDKYGGSIQNRFNIVFEIIQMIKIKHPKIVLSVRIPGQYNFENGMTLNESILFAKGLEDLGVKIINVSSGIGGWRRLRDGDSEGYLVEDASEIQRNVSIPVIGVGGIKTVGYVNKSLENRNFSLAAVGRSILNDVDWLFGQQNMT